MQRINKLRIKNFKFFLEEQLIDFEGKNLLLYGENGSGKSSIYWALYTFFQSVYKPITTDIAKYFDRTHPENLINIFSSAGDSSHIIVEYIAPDETITIKEISFAVQNTRTDSLIREASQSSDFINYRLLSRVYDFRNSIPIDLFALFETEVMTFISFGVEFKKGNNNAGDWWKFIEAGPQPRPNMNTVEYRDFQHKVGLFNSAMSGYLQDITQGTNEHLQNNFKEPLSISLSYEAASYNDFMPGSTTKRTHSTQRPKINLVVKYSHSRFNDDTIEIGRPQTFLNEARLTAIALSIRLAILDHKFIEPAPKLLVLDDLLISLDMSNRDIVLDLILTKYSNYQLLILTHDKSFFSMIKRRIESSKKSEHWVVREMFQKIEPNGIPVPFIPISGNNIDQAKKYFHEFDYPATANYLRKEVEKLIKSILPENKIFVLSREEGVKDVQLDTLIDNFRKFYESLGGDFTPFSRLKEYKDLLLNPLSHDNLKSPVYKIELEAVFRLVLLLQTLDAILLVDVNEDPIVLMEETDNSGANWIYEIEMLEKLRAVKMLDGQWKLTDPRCLFKKRTNLTTGGSNSINNVVNLVKGYDQIRYTLGIKASRPPKKLEDIVKKTNNTYLKTLLL